MTNLHLAILSTVLTLAIFVGLWFVYRRLRGVLNQAEQLAIKTGSMLQDHLYGFERSLRSHVVDESDALEKHVSDHALKAWVEAGETEGRIIDYIKAHFEDLRKHAEDLRNHAKDIADRAEVNSAPPREAPLRPRI